MRFLDITPYLEHCFEGAYVVDNERRFVYWNQSAEIIAGYTKEEMLGRLCQDNILMHTDECGKHLCTADCPLHWSMQANEVASASVFLKHKDGYRVPISVRTVPIEEEGAVVGAIEYFQVRQDTMERMYNLRELHALAQIDQLTGLPNRFYIQSILRSRINAASVLALSFGVLYMDFDNFKLFNDTFGHEAGDTALKLISQQLSKNMREMDFIGRWGGEEFLGIFLCPDDKALRKIAEKVRGTVERCLIPTGDRQANITASIGGTMYRSGESAQCVVTRADQCLYQSKRDGRNRVTIG